MPRIYCINFNTTLVFINRTLSWRDTAGSWNFNTTLVFINHHVCDSDTVLLCHFNTTLVFINHLPTGIFTKTVLISIQLLFLLISGARPDHQTWQGNFNTTLVFINLARNGVSPRMCLYFNTTLVFINLELLGRHLGMWKFQYNSCFY